jgi:hypothetical protein
MDPQSPNALLDEFLSSSPDDIIRRVRAVDWASASHSSKVIMGVACAAGRLEVVKGLLEKHPLLLNDACSGGFLHKLMQTPMFAPGSGNEVPRGLSPVMMASLFGQANVVEFLASQPRIRLNEPKGEDNWLAQHTTVLPVISGWGGTPEGAAVALPLIGILGARGSRFLMADPSGASALSMVLNALSDDYLPHDSTHPGRLAVVKALLSQIQKTEITALEKNGGRALLEIQRALVPYGTFDPADPLPSGVFFQKDDGEQAALTDGSAVMLPVWMEGFDALFPVVLGLMVDAGFSEDFLASPDNQNIMARVLAHRERHHLQEVVDPGPTTGDTFVQARPATPRL